MHTPLQNVKCPYLQWERFPYLILVFLLGRVSVLLIISDYFFALLIKSTAFLVLHLKIFTLLCPAFPSFI